MIKRLKPKSEFSKNVLTLMTGTTIAQALPIAISPILTRLYTPEEFGVYALFVAISSIFASIANGRYELAIMLPKKDEDALQIVALGVIIATFLSLFLLILILIFHTSIVSLFSDKSIGLWLYFIPLVVFLSGLFNVLNYFNLRQKNYKDLAKIKVLRSTIFVIVQLSMGFLKQGVFGLISGSLASAIAGNFKLFHNMMKNMLFSDIKPLKIIAVAKRYKKFPQFSMWAVLANTLSQHSTSILISILFNTATLGFYSFVQRVLGFPSKLIGSSIGQVYFQQATKEKQNTGTAIHTFTHTTKKLFLISTPIFGILFFIVEDLFAFVFGENWRISGVYAQIVIILFAIRFISSPLAIITTIFEKQKENLIINIILLILSVGSILISDFLDMSFESFLYIFSLSLSFAYFIFIFYYFYLSKGTIK